MQIGPYRLSSALVLAPMAGITDRPFRQLCRSFGAGLAVSEMVSSNSLLWGSEKTRRRADHRGEDEPRSVQIMGADPQMMAEAARYNVDNGAQIIDINMGCPAKKVCNVAAGSALLRDEALVGRILDAVVAAAARAGASDHLFKPFLDKGLVHKIRRVTQNRELRRMRRIHPTMALSVEVARDGESATSMELMDISIGGCRLRAPLSASGGLSIYDTARLALQGEAGPISLEGRLIRIAEDPDNAPHSVRVSYAFDNLPSQTREALGDLLETLRARWEQEH